MERACSTPAPSSAATAVARFEQDWAAYCGRRHAVGVANGTDALHLTHFARSGSAPATR